MSQKKSREDAGVAFGHLQSPFFAHGHAVEELDHATKSREDKTSRLREARLAKAEQDRLSPPTKPAVTRRKKA